MIMQTSSVAEKFTAQTVEVQNPVVANPQLAIELGLLTGCQDRPYAFGLAMALISQGVDLDIIGGDEIDSPELHTTPHLRFLNFRGNQKNQGNAATKLWKLLDYYAKLIRYAARSKPKDLAYLVEQQDRSFRSHHPDAVLQSRGKEDCLNRSQCEPGEARRERLVAQSRYAQNSIPAL